jgi:GT2 family glycosyltransferase
LIVVDNGSKPPAAARAAELADVAILNDRNLGFARGMNAGLEMATGRYVAFINNDTEFPPAWARMILETFTTHPRPGILAPAVTAAGNQVTVRDNPGSAVATLTPFGELPSGVVYVMEATVIRQLGGWNESYPIATGEDLDLCFTVWANGRDFVLDERILVRHESEATRSEKLANKPNLWRENLEIFLDKWTSPNPDVPRLQDCPPEEFQQNLAHARGAATWLRRYIELRDEANRLRSRSQVAEAIPRSRGLLARLSGR